jgi:hypothetical protein
MRIQRIPTASTMIVSQAGWFPATRLWLANRLINLGLKIGKISFEPQGNPMRADYRRMKKGQLN